jgi:hypothetical protein
MGVTSDFHGLTNARRRGQKMDEILNGWGFSLRDATLTPTAVNDCFLYMENIDPNPMVIYALEMTDAGAENIEFEVGPAYTTAGGAVPDVVSPLLVGSNNDYTDKALIEQGNDITGLVTSTTVSIQAVGAATRVFFDEPDYAFMPIVLGQGQALSVFAVTGTTAITELIAKWYHVETLNTDG